MMHLRKINNIDLDIVKIFKDINFKDFLLMVMHFLFKNLYFL